ncbi:tryptophan aminotransferase-related protein 2 [Typha latifolia]|uniref:tryptophan aminotransferase-related protein 2 n=1 Tax=Typha latifolia TaxID=4733 RepID=UPI003C2EB525
MAAANDDCVCADPTNGARAVTNASAIINLDHGDPTMFESFWRRIGEKGTIVIPGWQTMSYFSDATKLCWFLEPDFAHEVRRLHGLVGNAVVEERHVIVGTGSTQLFQAALYALSPPDASEPMSVVSAVPYYSSYPSVTDYLRSGLFRWFGDAHAFKGETYIELVCSPNNPDGTIKEAVLKSKFGKTIHDLAYYWPQYTAIVGTADHDIMLFTVSKSTGHAGTRLGWALVKDRDVAKKMVKFIELNTIGVSKDSQLRAAKILKVVSDGYELPNPDGMDKLFDFGRRLMAARWERLHEAVKASGFFSLPEFSSGFCTFFKERTATYPAFAWLKCEKEEIRDCEGFLKEHNILTRSGKHFGVASKFVRVSMLDRDENFDLFVKRISSLGSSHLSQKV